MVSKKKGFKPNHQKGCSRLTRRAFLKSQAALGFCAASASMGVLSLPGYVWGQDSLDIALVEGDPGPATQKAVQLLGDMGSFVGSGDRVVIKPNMSFAHDPERATNTHPEVVRVLAELSLQAGASRVRVLDNTLQSAQSCLELSGIQAACSGLQNTRVQALSSSRYFQEVDLKQGESFRRTEVMREVLDADVLIAAPVAKSHSATGVSLSMKGMMGLIRNRGVMHSRYDLNQAIVDLCTFLWADLTVVDATRVLSSHGPQGPGEVIRADQVIASRDMVAADAMAVNLFPWYGQKIQPRQVEHIRMAHERGLGRMDIENLSTHRTKS